MNADRGHDHDRDHEGGADGAEEASAIRRPLPTSLDRGGRREDAPRAEPEAFEEAAGAGQPVAAEPSEEFLGAVRRHEKPEDEPEGENS